MIIMENKWNKYKGLADKMEEYAQHYKCTKCNDEKACKHVIEDRYKFFKKEISAALRDLSDTGL